MSWLPPLSALTLLAAALFASRLAEAGSGRRRFGLLVVGASAALQGIVWSRERSASVGTIDGDPFSSFLSLVVLAALAFAFAFAHRRVEASPPPRLLLGGALALLGVATRDLLLAVAAIEIYVFCVLVQEGKEGPKRWWLVASFLGLLGLATVASLALVAWASGGATDLAAVAAAGEDHAGARRVGLGLLVASMAGSWLVHSRRALRFSRDLVSGVTSSFVLLVLTLSVLARLPAWLPDAGLTDVFRVLALSGLALGALGMLGATRITTFVTALTVERGAALVFALLGGVHARAPLLLELVAAGTTLLLLALALEPARGGRESPFALDDLAKLESSPARLLLLLAALSAAPLPPFPGFVARLAAMEAVLLEGHSLSAVLSAAFAFLAGVGAMRLVARAFSSPGEARAGGGTVKVATLGLALALAAVWFLSLSPEPLWDAAARAAMGIF